MRASETNMNDIAPETNLIAFRPFGRAHTRRWGTRIPHTTPPPAALKFPLPAEYLDLIRGRKEKSPSMASSSGAAPLPFYLSNSNRIVGPWGDITAQAVPIAGFNPHPGPPRGAALQRTVYFVDGPAVIVHYAVFLLICFAVYLRFLVPRVETLERWCRMGKKGSKRGRKPAGATAPSLEGGDAPSESRNQAAAAQPPQSHAHHLALQKEWEGEVEEEDDPPEVPGLSVLIETAKTLPLVYILLSQRTLAVRLLHAPLPAL